MAKVLFYRKIFGDRLSMHCIHVYSAQCLYLEACCAGRGGWQWQEDGKRMARGNTLTSVRPMISGPWAFCESRPELWTCLCLDSGVEVSELADASNQGPTSHSKP